MAWPPATLPINRTDATPQQGTHPADHNAVNLAVNDTIAAIKIADGFVRFQPTGNTDNSQSGFTNWIVAGINIPVWARQVIVTTTIAGLYQVNAADGFFELATVLDVTQGDTVFFNPTVVNSRGNVTYVDRWTPPRTGLVNIIIVARRAFGSSVLRVDTSSTVRWAARFIP